MPKETKRKLLNSFVKTSWQLIDHAETQRRIIAQIEMPVEDVLRQYLEELSLFWPEITYLPQHAPQELGRIWQVSVSKNGESSPIASNRSLLDIVDGDEVHFLCAPIEAEDTKLGEN